MGPRIDYRHAVARLRGDVDPAAIRARRNAFWLNADDESGQNLSCAEIESRRGARIFVGGVELIPVREDCKLLRVRAGRPPTRYRSRFA